VRQRLTELELDVVLHQVPVEHEDRTALVAAAGTTTIPVLVAEGETVAGEAAIVEFLDDHCRSTRRSPASARSWPPRASAFFATSTSRPL
jgi:glutathione S-transferase